MPADSLLQGIFKQQLVLAQEIRRRLGDVVDEALEQAFDANETHLESLLHKADVSPDDLTCLQNLWDDLNHQLGRVKLQTKEAVSEKKPAATPVVKDTLNKLYTGN